MPRVEIAHVDAVAGTVDDAGQLSRCEVDRETAPGDGDADWVITNMTPEIDAFAWARPCGSRLPIVRPSR